MVRMRAKVRSEANAPRQAAVSLNNERTSSEKTAHFPIPDSIEIEGGHAGGYLLIHIYLREGPFIHTWHSPRSRRQRMKRRKILPSRKQIGNL